MSQMPRRVRGWFALTLAAVAAAPAALPVPLRGADPDKLPSAPKPDTSPPESPAPDAATKPAAGPAQRISDAIDALGSGDFAERERAAKALWALGDAARPALEEATRSDDPEVARRARGVLASFAFGVRPDTPKPVLDLLNQYRTGDPEQRKSAAGSLAGQGAAGARVLLKLAGDEPDPEVRQIVVNALGQVARPAVAQLVVEGDLPTAERMLATLAPHAEHAARDHAAFLLLAGGLDDALAKLEDPKDPNNVPPADKLRKAWLYRAKGDAARAAEAAAAAGEQPLADALLADAGRYADLAEAVDQRATADASVEQLGFATAYHRLAGDQAGADKWAGRLLAYATAHPSDHFNAVEALLLNERVDPALDVLVSRQNFAAAADYLTARLDFARFDDLVAKARADGSSDLPKLMCKQAVMRHFAGRAGEAAETLRAVARGEHGQPTFDTWVELIESARAAGVDREAADVWAAQALSTARPQEDLSKVFDRGGFADGERALRWWLALRDHRAGHRADEAMAIVRKLDRKQLAADELTALLTRTRELAKALPTAQRVLRLRLVADTLADHGKPDEAIALSEEIVRTIPVASQLMPLGDLYAGQKKWEQAAGAFGRAFAADPTSAPALALQGWALTQQGKQAEGRKLIDLAHLLPLANESARHALADALAKHGLKDDARRERELTARLGDPASWEVCDSVRRLADDVAAKDPLAAAALWDRAFLANLTTRTMFVDASANLSIPVLIRRTKAVGKARAGDAAGAVADARACFQMMPGDADAQIAVVRELDKAGKKSEADAVYRPAFDHFEAIRKRYPDSAPANNLVAWLCGTVKRDLDHALTCARKGVELEPRNTAILDTLSEVHFARGEYDAALAINKQCREMEPHVRHHKDNQERFERAKAGKPEAADEPED